MLCIIRNTINGASILALELNYKPFLRFTFLRGIAIIDSVTRSLRMYRGKVLSTDISCSIILLEIEPLLIKLPIHEIADYHTFGPVRNIALVADIGSGQSVISGDHHTPDCRSLQSGNSTLAFRLQPILKHLKSIEKKPFLSLVPSHGVYGRLVDRLASNAKHSESMRGVVVQYFLVVGWHALPLHDSGHHFG